MNKKVFSLCLGAVLLLLASCSGGYSSKEIDGVEFTGEGVFGDVPYICMDFLKEFNKSFKAKVLDLAMSEINEKTDMNVEYTQIKKGRVVTGFQFTIKAKNKRKEKDVTPNNGDYWLSEKQLKKST